MASHHLPTVALYACIVSLGGFLFGFDASVISGAVGSVVGAFDLDEWQTGLVVSAPTLAAALTALIIGPASDLVGRKRVLLLVALLYLLSAGASALAPNFWSLVAARGLGGAAFGSLVLAPLYIAEISPSKWRGRLVSINQMNIMVGMSVAYFSNYFLLEWSQSTSAPPSFLSGSNAWRWMLGMETLPATLFCLLMLLVPESPRWLILRGRIDEARRVLRKLAPHADPEPALEEIHRTAAAYRARGRGRLAELFRPELRMALVVGLLVAAAQQITGINAVFFYATSIFEQCGVGQRAAFVQATYVGLINVVFTAVAMALIDRIGRKPLLLAGLLGVAASMSLAAYGFSQARYRLTPASIERMLAAGDAPAIDPALLIPLHDLEFANDVAYKRALREALGDQTVNSHQGALVEAAVSINPHLVLIGVLGFVASFAVSLGPVMWVLISEIYPGAIRGLAMAVIGLINSGISWGVQFFFPWQLNHLGSAATFFTYALFAAILFALLSVLLEETRGKTLEQIEHGYSAG